MSGGGHHTTTSTKAPITLPKLVSSPTTTSNRQQPASTSPSPSPSTTKGGSTTNTPTNTTTSSASRHGVASAAQGTAASTKRPGDVTAPGDATATGRAVDHVNEGAGGGGSDGDGDDAVSGFHQRQLDDYLRFSISKRNAALRDVEIAFRAAKDARLNPGNVYSCEEVSDIIDSISPVVKGDIQKELLHTTHTTALVLCQLFAQAEDIFLDLHIDTAQLENEYLLREMEHFEEAFSTGEKRLKPLSRAITMPALQHVKGEKEKADDRFRRLQIQCTTILKEKTAYGEEIERLKAEKMLLAKQYSSSSGKSTAAITDEISSRHLMSQTELATMKEKTAKLEQELEETRQQLHLESQKVSRAERELLKKVQTTTPFVNMKKMLKQKNDQLKALRDIIARVAPEELPPEPRIDDERE